MYKIEDVKNATLRFFKGDELVTKIWMSKYCLKDKEGNYLEMSPLDMYMRLAGEIARIEQKYPNPMSYEEIMFLLDDHIVPSGSVCYGVGNNHSLSSLANCFVVGNKSDSISGIFTVDQEQAQLMKRRGGVGHDMSHLREKGAVVNNAAATSSGPIPFMHQFSNTTRVIAQDGRRGALMLTMRADHPNVLDFIKAKEDKTKVTGANISIKIEDSFMRNLKMDTSSAFSKFHENTMLKDKAVWKELIKQAHATAEPGILFWDTIIRNSPADCYKGFQSISTNPCGEIPLCPYDSCRLLSIDLYSFVENPFTDKARFNWTKFKKVVIAAQRILDDIIDLEEEKINRIIAKIEKTDDSPEIKQIELNLWLKIKRKLLSGRRTGLSGIGLADAVAAINMKYSSQGSLIFIESIYKELAVQAYISSGILAKERGAFPVWEQNVESHNPFIKRILFAMSKEPFGTKLLADYRTHGRRNIAILTLPPSGTIAQLRGITPGAEPLFMPTYMRRKKINANDKDAKVDFVDANGDSWEEHRVFHPKFLTWMEVNKFSMEDVMADLDKYINISPYKGATAHEVDPYLRINIQGTIQRWIDHSISSTINLPKKTPRELVGALYEYAWSRGCKGLTVYRDGCRDGVLIPDKKADVEDEVDFSPIDSVKRPKDVKCEVFHTTSKDGPYNVFVGLLQGKPLELFATTNIVTKKPAKGIIKKVKRGHYKIEGDVSVPHLMENMSDAHKAITRLISGQLRHRRHIKYVVEDLRKLGGELHSFNMVLARILKKFIEEKETITGANCSECGSPDLIYQEGCEKCLSCDVSKCG